MSSDLIMLLAERLMRIIAELLYPSDTVMDLNIGAALWLAARATGRLCTVLPTPAGSLPSGQAADTPASAIGDATSVCRHRQLEEHGSWTSQAKVVLLGQGADEQCAGYGRHRTRFREAVRNCNSGSSTCCNRQ